MRVIDLLNKIANGEEVPKEIYYRRIKYTYDDYMADYKRDIGTNLFTYLFSHERTNCFINEEVEVIEDKKIEKLPIGLKQTIKNGIHNTLVLNDIQYELNEKEEIICSKINEIIDKLEDKQC